MIILRILIFIIFLAGIVKKTNYPKCNSRQKLSWIDLKCRNDFPLLKKEMRETWKWEREREMAREKEREIDIKIDRERQRER